MLQARQEKPLPVAGTALHLVEESKVLRLRLRLLTLALAPIDNSLGAMRTRVRSGRYLAEPTSVAAARCALATGRYVLYVEQRPQQPPRIYYGGP